MIDEDGKQNPKGVQVLYQRSRLQIPAQNGTTESKSKAKQKVERRSKKPVGGGRSRCMEKTLSSCAAKGQKREPSIANKRGERIEWSEIWGDIKIRNKKTHSRIRKGTSET
jgi:hypothetical protein